ncbi:hypothetical protein C0J52_26742 [Blattella germanica]|nr:hypothetical protein C0J52_26742 [Blattella germanica]
MEVKEKKMEYVEQKVTYKDAIYEDDDVKKDIANCQIKSGDLPPKDTTAAARILESGDLPPKDTTAAARILESGDLPPKDTTAAARMSA